MEWTYSITDNVRGNSKWDRAERSASIGPKEGNEGMTELFLNAFFAVRGFHGNLLERARNERGASMVEYALLVGLIAVVAVVAIAALGGGISGLFKTANTCVGGLNSTSC
jgi:pilus assembly protein Flp/PilA